MQETWVLSVGWEDPLEKEMATYSSFWGFFNVLVVCILKTWVQKVYFVSQVFFPYLGPGCKSSSYRSSLLIGWSNVISSKEAASHPHCGSLHHQWCAAKGIVWEKWDLADVGGSPVEVWISSGLPWEWGHWQQQSWKMPLCPLHILAWEILWTEEPGALQSMGSQNSWTWLSN